MPKIKDDYTKRILAGLSTSPKCPRELSRIYGIPIAICYERIRKLESRGFIEKVLTLFTQSGKALRFYKISCRRRQLLVQPLT
ncbi:MAG: hypothetical protein ACE5IO_00795 [Thermoplasmata archaeon]